LKLAYVLISTEIGAEKEVLEHLKTIPEVMEAYIVYGVYDIVVKIAVEEIDQLRDIITSRIRRFGKVRSTLTMIVVEGFSK